MTVMLCIDERGGMLFMNRRLSRDRILMKDIEKEVGEGILYISEFSEDLFPDSSISVMSVPEPLLSAGKEDFVFIENEVLVNCIDIIDRLIIYNWNRSYPYDFELDINPRAFFTLKESYDFKGSSHDKITKEIFVK